MSAQEGFGFFGHPDAYLDRQHFKSFVPIEAYERAKRGAVGSRLFITGVLGSGKSALNYRIATEAKEATALVWPVDEFHPPRQSIDFTQLRQYTGSIANVTLNFLSWELANRVRAERKAYTPNAMKKLDDLFPRIVHEILGFAKTVASATKVKTPVLDVLELDLGKVIKAKGGTLAEKLPLDAWHEALQPCLSERSAFILLDDLELLFPGLDELPEAVDGLLLACDWLNDKFGASLTCLVFLQWSTFVQLQRRPRSDRRRRIGRCVFGAGQGVFGSAMGVRVRSGGGYRAHIL